MQVGAGNRQGGKPLKTWIKKVRESLQNLRITDGLSTDHVAWRARIRLTDPDNLKNEL